MIEVELIHASRADSSLVQAVSVYGYLTEPDDRRLFARRECTIAGPGAPANSPDFVLNPANPHPVPNGELSSATIEKMVAVTLLANSKTAVLTAHCSWADVRMRRERFGGFVFVPLTSALVELAESEFTCLEESIRAGDPSIVEQVETIPVTRMLYELCVSGALTLSYVGQRVNV